MTNLTSRRIDGRLTTLSYPKKMQERVVFHLAAQGVVARSLRIPVRQIEVDLDLAKGRVEHPPFSHDRLSIYQSTEAAWVERDRPERMFEHPVPRRTVYLAHVVTLLSGPAAERHFCGGTPRFNTLSEGRELNRLLLVHCRCNRRLPEQKAQLLVRIHSDEIVKVARRLLVSDTMSESELDAVIGDELVDQRRRLLA